MWTCDPCYILKLVNLSIPKNSETTQDLGTFFDHLELWQLPPKTLFDPRWRDLSNLPCPCCNPKPMCFYGGKWPWLRSEDLYQPSIMAQPVSTNESGWLETADQSQARKWLTLEPYLDDSGDSSDVTDSAQFIASVKLDHCSLHFVFSEWKKGSWCLFCLDDRQKVRYRQTVALKKKQKPVSKDL